MYVLERQIREPPKTELAFAGFGLIDHFNGFTKSKRRPAEIDRPEATDGNVAIGLGVAIVGEEQITSTRCPKVSKGGSNQARGEMNEAITAQNQIRSGQRIGGDVCSKKADPVSRILPAVPLDQL